MSGRPEIKSLGLGKFALSATMAAFLSAFSRIVEIKANSLTACPYVFDDSSIVQRENTVRDVVEVVGDVGGNQYRDVLFARKPA